ncbi:hypothetical protein BCCGELA001_29750 [Bradyrhizobium sp. CCGE-LA001]|nr:hypothetical protein BCCGELA001_29750 [Bradyrhizobium sp. CCGE-LA001]
MLRKRCFDARAELMPGRWGFARRLRRDIGTIGPAMAVRKNDRTQPTNGKPLLRISVRWKRSTAESKDPHEVGRLAPRIMSCENDDLATSDRPSSSLADMQAEGPLISTQVAYMIEL